MSVWMSSSYHAHVSCATLGITIDSAAQQSISGDVYPVVSVSGGALLNANFGQAEFKCGVPRGFDPVSDMSSHHITSHQELMS